MSFNDLVSAIGPVLPDNTSTALEIEGVDSKDYITIDTRSLFLTLGNLQSQFKLVFQTEHHE